MQYTLKPAWGKTPTADAIMASLDCSTPSKAMTMLLDLAGDVANALRVLQAAVKKVRDARALAEGNRNSCCLAYNSVVDMGRTLANAIQTLAASDESVKDTVVPGERCCTVQSPRPLFAFCLTVLPPSAELLAPHFFMHLAPDLVPCMHAFAPWGGWAETDNVDQETKNLMMMLNTKYQDQVRKLVCAAPVPPAIKAAAK